MRERKFWACLRCKNRKNELHLAKCSTCSSGRQPDRYAIRENGAVYYCKAITGLPIPMLSIYCISADNQEKHVRIELPMNNDSVEECVREGIDIVHYGAAADDEYDTTIQNAAGTGTETANVNLTLGVDDVSTTSTHESELDSAGKPLQGISLFDRMMRDAAKESYDPAIGRFIPTETVYLSPNRSIIKTDLNYIDKMAAQKKEMTRVVESTIKRREIEAERNRPRRGGGPGPAEQSEADKSLGSIVFQQTQELVAKEARQPCALCERPFPLSALLGRITFKTVGEWRAARCAPIPAEDKRFNHAFIHNAVKLCLFCTSFFDKDFSDCIDKSSIHQAIGLPVDPVEGVVDPTNKESRRRIISLIETQAAPDRPLSAIKHKVAVEQIKEWKERNNDPNAKFLYDPKATTGSKFVKGASDARTLRDTYTDLVMVKTLQERGKVEERNAKERESKRKQWLDRLSGKMPNSSPPKKSDKDRSASSVSTRGTSRGRKEKENNPNSARSDSGTIGRRGKSRSPSVSRSKTAGNALETVNERGRRGRAAKRGGSLNRRGGSVTSQKSVGSVGSNKSGKTTATATSTRSLGRRGRSATGGYIKSSGYTSAPWGATPVKIKQSRGSSLPPQRRSQTSVSRTTTKSRTTKHPAVPRLSGRARKAARNAPKPVERKALLVMVRDKKAEKGTRTWEMGLGRRKAEEEGSVHLSNSVFNGIDPLRASVSMSSTKKDMVVPIEPLVANKRVSKQQEQLIRSAASAYNPQGVYSPPESKKRKQPSVVTRSTHANSAVPSAAEAERKKAMIEEKLAQKFNASSSRRSMSPPMSSTRASQASSAFVRDPPVSAVGAEQAELPKPAAVKAAPKARPKLEIQTKAPPKAVAVEPPAKKVSVVEQIDKAATEEVVSDISDDEDDYVPTGLAAKLVGKNVDGGGSGSMKKSPSPVKSMKFAVGDDDEDNVDDYGDDSDFDAYDVAHMAESALNEASQLDSSAHETPMDFLPGEDTMDQYMFASSGVVQKPENPDKWSPEDKLPGQALLSPYPRVGDSASSALQKQLFSLDAAFGAESGSPMKAMKGGMAKNKAKKSVSPQKVGFQVQESTTPPLSYQRIQIKGINSSKGEKRYVENSPGDNSQDSDQSAYFGDKSYSSPPGEEDKRSRAMHRPTSTAQQELIDKLEWEQLTPAAAKLPAAEAIQAQKNLADAYSYMGDTCKDKGDLSGALSAFENAFRLERDEISSNPDLVQRKLESLVVLAINAGENEKATNLCEELVSTSLDEYGEKSIEFAKSEVFTSKILLHQGQPVDAAELLNDAVVILEKTVGKQHQLAVEARGVLADALNDAIVKHNALHGSPEKAEKSPGKGTQYPKKSSPKKVKTPSAHLTDTKKSPTKAQVAEEQVQKRIKEEVEKKMAAEKRKMQAQMEKMMAKQVAEQMAAMQATIQAQMKEQLELQMKVQSKIESPVPQESIISALDSLSMASVETSKALGSPASTIGSTASHAPSPVKTSPPPKKKKGVAMASPPPPASSPSPPPSPPAESESRASPDTSMLANTTLSPSNPYAPAIATIMAGSPDENTDVKAEKKKSPLPVQSKSPEVEVTTKLEDDYVIDMSAYEMRASPVHASPSLKKVQYAESESSMQSPSSPHVLMQSPNASFSNKTPRSVRMQSPPGSEVSTGKKAVRMHSPPPFAVRLDSSSSNASSESPVLSPKPRVRMRSPPPQRRCASSDDEAYSADEQDEEVQVVENEYTDLHLMKMALGDGDGDVSDDDYAYDDGEFEESAGAGADGLGVDENAGPNAPPKPRPSSVSRKLQTHVQNARGMELLDSGQKSPTRTLGHSEEEKGIERLTAAQYGEDYGPSGLPEALEKMKLLTLGVSGQATKRSALRSRESNAAEGQSGMVMLSKGSSFVKNKVASIAAAELHDEEDVENKGVKHRIKKKVQI